jgi:hypothetical protein
MDIVETRRENLRRWIRKNGTPKNEKSMFSQLKGTASFGEKIARRLEDAYGMGAGYLDTPNAPVAVVAPPADTDLEAMLKLTIQTAEEMRVLITYRRSGPDGKDIINGAVESALGLIREGARDEGESR